MLRSHRGSSHNRGLSSTLYTRAALKHLLLMAFGILMLYPLLWMLKSSFTPESHIFDGFGLIPRPHTWENYVSGWGASYAFQFSRYIFNSLVIVGGCIIGNVVSCSLTAYAFARLNFRFKGILFGLMMAGIMLPYHVVAVPQYIMFSKLHLAASDIPLILPKLLATDSFFVFLMVQFLRGIPRELDEAAAIDGAGSLRTFWYVILPMLRPAVATTVIFTFFWTWNDFFAPLIYLTDASKYTVALGLNSLLDSQTSTGWGPLMAMSVVSLIPIYIVFVVAQKQLVQGIATTGLKG